MSWLQTITGRAVSLPKPHPDEIYILDIARGLGQPRYNNQTKFPYSVAQHVCLLHDFVPDEYKYAALMHDAAEGYLGDLADPIKRLPLLAGFLELEAMFEEVIFEKFDVDPELVKEFKDAGYDKRITLNERDDICAPPPKPWGIEHLEKLEGVGISFWPAPIAEGQFLKRFFKLKPKFKPKETFNREVEV